MNNLDRVRKILRASLSLGDRANALTEDSPLLGGIPEFDSMAVVAIIAMIEDDLGVAVDDDELSADIFATVGTLASFVSAKTPS